MPGGRVETIHVVPVIAKALVGRGGLRADVIEGGETAAGDEVVDLGPAE